MNLTAEPEDVAALKARLAATEAALAAAEATVAEMAEANRRLERMIAELRREKFGPRSEKLSPDQYNLPLEDVEIAQGIPQAAQENVDATLKASRSAGERVKRDRKPLPPGLPEIERVIEPASTLCPCGCGQMTRIGEDVSRRLDVIPAQFRVLVTRRPKYACRRCSGAVVQAHAPEQPSGPRSVRCRPPDDIVRAGPGPPRERARRAADRGADRPCDRLQVRRSPALAPAGRDLPPPGHRHRPRDPGQLGRPRLLPPQACRRADARPSGRLGAAVHGRDAPAGARPRTAGNEEGLLLGHGRRRSGSGRRQPTNPSGGRVRADRRRRRAHGGPAPPVVVFRYAPSREGVHAERFLEGFRGRYLQCDAYDGYNRLRELDRPEGGWTLVHCWSHVRRRFVTVHQSTGSPIAETMIRHISGLYAVEKTVRGFAPDARLTARGQLSAPIVAAIKPWLEKQLSRISSGSKLAEHIRYTLGAWDGLLHFLDDGRLELDTNPIENLIRPVALTRKNSLFAGHEIGAENRALLASLVATSKINGVEPVAYLAATMTAILDGHPMSRLDELMPRRFQATSSETVQAVA